jgi:chromatin segregation and condensation protein Rec8/ScpA/Scc1 (kleisin family)
MEIAVTLLAVLELIKRREVTAVQESLFGPIDIREANVNKEAASLAEQPQT